MSDLQEISIVLPAHILEFIKGRVASGAYGTESDVIQQGVQLLRSQQLDADDWIRSEVLPALAEYDVDPTQGLSTEQMRQSLARKR